jgi:hypothetical protein
MKFFRKLSGEKEQDVVEKVLGPSYKYYKQMDHLMNMNKYQTRIPYEIEVY